MHRHFYTVKGRFHKLHVIFPQFYKFYVSDSDIVACFVLLGMVQSEKHGVVKFSGSADIAS